jgi:hypothetical protein
MDFISYLRQTLTEQLPAMIAAYEGDLSASSLTEMEQAVKQLTQAVGNTMMQQWLEAQTPKYPQDGCPCRHCGGRARYVRRRAGMSITLLGRVYYRRPYYLCAACGQGHYPLDEQLGIQAGQMSSAVVQLAALVGVQTAFARSRDLLLRTAQLDLSANSIRKATQQVGQCVRDDESQWVNASQDLAAQREHQRQSPKPQQLYGSLDGFMVHVEGQWHEFKAGVWWTTQRRSADELTAENIAYYTDWLPAADFSPLVWATGFQRLADQAEQIIFVADAAEWIWRIVQQHFPTAVQIVDWYHASAYVHGVALAAFADQTARQAWLEQQLNHLWHGRLTSVFRACRDCAAVAPAAVNKTLTYLANNRSRMRYDRFRAAGFQIGSGTMESGCKQLGAGRLKIAGAQWSDEGARLVAKARAAYLSGQWDEITLPEPAPPQVA